MQLYSYNKNFTNFYINYENFRVFEISESHPFNKI
jgi:hypothetical protein